MNILIVISDGKIEAVYTSEIGAHTFVLDYDEPGKDLTDREQDCIMLGFPYNANPEPWDLDPPPVMTVTVKDEEM